MNQPGQNKQNEQSRDPSRFAWFLIENRSILFIVLRIVAVAGVFCAGWIVLTRFMPHNIFGAFAVALFGFALFLAAAVLIAGPIARLLSSPFGNLFYKSEHYSRPPPNYSIPQARRKSGRYEEAFEMYEQISQDFPQELTPYVEMMHIALTEMKNPGLAEAAYQHGLKTLRREESREALSRMHKAFTSSEPASTRRFPCCCP